MRCIAGWIAMRNEEPFHGLAAFKDYTTICNSAPSEFLAILALQHAAVIVERNLHDAALDASEPRTGR